MLYLGLALAIVFAAIIVHLRTRGSGSARASAAPTPLPAPAPEASSAAGPACSSLEANPVPAKRETPPEDEPKPEPPLADPALRPAPRAHVEDMAIEIGEPADEEPTGPLPLILVTAVGRTDPGRKRRHNEDSYLVRMEDALFVIADGMGGYAAGEVASQLAVDTIESAFAQKSFAGAPNPTRPRRGDELVRAIEMANAVILAQSRANEAQAGMGTTLVSARFSVNKQRVYIAHVGDSRCYRLRDGKIEQLTVDHTLASMGIVGKNAAKLTRALGIADEVEVDLRSETAQPGDHYVLCSDGLSKMIPDEEISRIIYEAGDLDAACQTLIERANEAGGRDNVTVILIRVDMPAEFARAQA